MNSRRHLYSRFFSTTKAGVVDVEVGKKLRTAMNSIIAFQKNLDPKELAVADQV